jgi:hypothetical protein
MADGRWQLQGSSKAEEQLNAWLRQSQHSPQLSDLNLHSTQQLCLKYSAVMLEFCTFAHHCMLKGQSAPYRGA